MLSLTLERVSFVAAGQVLIDNLSVQIEAGTRTVILGPNGAGKSVLMRLCHGLLAPTSGSIIWNPAGPERQAMVFQHPVMLRRTALSNVVYALKLARFPAGECQDRAAAALQRVGLTRIALRPARILSGGEQQRLALARAWALEPQVLFLDEPTANLDPSAAREVEAIINAIHACGTKVIMSTHNLGQARRVSDDILFLDAGRLGEYAPTEQFFDQPQSVAASAFIHGELPWR